MMFAAPLHVVGVDEMIKHEGSNANASVPEVVVPSENVPSDLMVSIPDTCKDPLMGADAHPAPTFEGLSSPPTFRHDDITVQAPTMLPPQAVTLEQAGPPAAPVPELPPVPTIPPVPEVPPAPELPPMLELPAVPEFPPIPGVPPVPEPPPSPELHAPDNVPPATANIRTAERTFMQPIGGTVTPLLQKPILGEPKRGETLCEARSWFDHSRCFVRRFRKAAEAKGRTKAEVDEIICYPAG
jgi:hypothetical protein